MGININVYCIKENNFFLKLEKKLMILFSFTNNAKCNFEKKSFRFCIEILIQ